MKLAHLFPDAFRGIQNSFIPDDLKPASHNIKILGPVVSSLLPQLFRCERRLPGDKFSNAAALLFHIHNGSIVTRHKAM